MQINAFTISLIIATLINSVLVYFTWKNRPAKASTELFFLLIAITEWSLAAVLESMATTVFYKILFSILSYIGITTVPVLFLIFVCRYVGLNKFFTKRNISLLFIIPVITLIIASTNQLHGLLWTAVTLGNNSLAGIYGIYAHGIWFWVNAIYSYILLFTGILILLIMMSRSWNLFLRQTRVFIFSSILPFIANLIYILSPETISGIDITPVSFTFSGIMLFFAIFYYKVFDLSPVAWNAIIEKLDDGVILFNKQDQVVDINGSFRKLFGLSKVKIGIDKNTLLEKYPRIRLFCDMGTGNRKKEIPVNIADKKYFLQLNHSDLYNKRGNNIIGQMLFIRDITPERAARQRLNEAKIAAEEATKIKSRFLANMSHEIRTPINAILGFSELLDDLVETGTQKQYLASIRSSGKALLYLINDILDLSKIEAGKIELQYSPVNLRKLFDEIVMTFASKIEGKGLKFLTAIDKDLPKALQLDKVRVRQILFNLVGNAVKFTHEGYIRLEVKGTYYEDRSKIGLEFIVKDTGIGISSENKELIFEAFHQSKRQNFGKYGGTGLGLSITKRLVEAMGGKIGLESTIGRGSSFNVTLDNIAVASLDELSDNSEDRVSTSIRFKGQTVLIADDIESNRILIREMLKLYNLKTIEAVNGKEAVEMATVYHPDLILMDLRMPIMDGYKAIKALKADSSLKDIPAILLTASVMKEQEEKIDKLNCEGHLRKPVKKKELLRELIKHLDYSEDREDKTIGEAPVSIEEIAVLTPDQKKKLPELIELLEGKIKNDLAQVLRSFIIDDIKDFASNMGKLGKEYNIGLLSMWADKITAQATSFDMDNLPATLNKFDDLVDEVKKSLD